ncbi:MAG: GNAT family N-acetyltransferase [Acidimicrobiales bacterium]|nr:GNAT family N-acetyltransferase [Acidimicrobiales bacterium]
MPRLRPYVPDDAAGALALNQANVPEVGSADAERWAWLLELADHAEVVEDDGEVVAFLVAFAEGSIYDSPNYRWYGARHERFAYVDRVAVAEAHRGTGIAHQLYESFEAWGRGRGAGVLCAEVNTVPPNPRSLRFHERLGFRPVAELEPWADEPGHLVAMVERPVAQRNGRTDRGSRVVLAPSEQVYAALTDPEALVAWLPPSGMHGRFEHVDLRAGGSYRLVLSYDDPDDASGAKAADGTDVVEARILEVDAGRRIVQAVDFESDDPAFAGTMTMAWMLAPVADGTRVEIVADDVPVGISAEDHAAGIHSSLVNLATHVE